MWPDWGNDSSGGLDISVPLYVNLAPNYDALYAPRFIEDRGLDHQLQLRYMNPRLGDWFAGGAYLANDKKFEGQSPENSSDRWLAVLRQNGLFKQRWRSRIDYSKASDVDYLQDLETANIDALRETSLLQLVSIDYLGDKWLMTLQAQKFQSLADDISNEYEKLPQFTSRYRSSGAPIPCNRYSWHNIRTLTQVETLSPVSACMVMQASVTRCCGALAFLNRR